MNHIRSIHRCRHPVLGVFLIFSLFLTRLPGYSYNDRDRQLPKADMDLTKILQYFEICDSLSAPDPTQAIIYARQARTIARTLNDPENENRAVFRIGKCLYQLKQYDQAIAILDSNLQYYTGTGQQSEIGVVHRELAYAYNDSKQYAPAAEHYGKAAEVFGKLGQKNDFARAANNAGMMYWYQGALANALKYYQRSLDAFTELDDRHWMGTVLNNIGTIYWGISEYNEALDSFDRAFKLAEETGNIKGSILSLNNIGLVYQEWKNYDQAIARHQQALEMAKEIDFTYGIAYSQINIGQYYESQKEYDKAMDSYQQAYLNYLAEDRYLGISVSLKHIGDIYNLRGQLPTAIEHYKLSEDYAEKAHNLHRKAIVLHALAIAYQEVGEYELATWKAEESLEISNSNTYQDLIRDNYFTLSEIAEKQGNYDVSLSHYKAAKEIQDQIFNDEKIKEFTHFEIRYNTEKKERENQLLRKENQIQQLAISRDRLYRNFLVAMIGLGVIILGFIIFWNMVVRKKNSLLTEQNIQIQNINDQNAELIRELQDALDKVKHLRGLLPICSKCKKIRDDQGYWNDVEAYVQKHSDASFTHGICPDCLKELYPDYHEAIMKKIEKRKSNS